MTFALKTDDMTNGQTDSVVLCVVRLEMQSWGPLITLTFHVGVGATSRPPRRIQVADIDSALDKISRFLREQPRI